MGTVGQAVTPKPRISLAAISRSQRGNSTEVPLTTRGTFIPACIPTTWNIGAAVRKTSGSPMPNHSYMQAAA